MRVLELALSGILALTVPVAGHADPVRSKIGPVGAGPAPSIVHVWGGNGPGFHPMPNGWDGDWRRVPSPSHQWNGRSVSRGAGGRMVLPTGGLAVWGRASLLTGSGVLRSELLIIPSPIGEDRLVAGAIRNQAN